MYKYLLKVHDLAMPSVVERTCSAQGMTGYIARLAKDVPGRAKANLTLYLPLDGIDSKSSATTVPRWQDLSRGNYCIWVFEVICTWHIGRGMGSNFIIGF